MQEPYAALKAEYQALLEEKYDHLTQNYNPRITSNLGRVVRSQSEGLISVRFAALSDQGDDWAFESYDLPPDYLIPDRRVGLEFDAEIADVVRRCAGNIWTDCTNDLNGFAEATSVVNTQSVRAKRAPEGKVLKKDSKSMRKGKDLWKSLIQCWKAFRKLIHGARRGFGLVTLSSFLSPSEGIPDSCARVTVMFNLPAQCLIVPGPYLSGDKLRVVQGSSDVQLAKHLYMHSYLACRRVDHLIMPRFF